MAVIACAVSAESKGGPIFRQIRIGREGRPFLCFKFRTMYQNAPKSCPASALTDPQRYVTPLGRLLRQTSLDELPQLWNVLLGDMSLVGPRPLIPEERSIHRMRQRSGVYTCRPGMSGLAQISGRNELSDGEKNACDRYYAEHLSWGLDAKILLHTLRCVVRREGICTPNASCSSPKRLTGK